MSIEPLLPIVTPSGWFDAEDAPSRAELNTCIHCGLCLTACPTYRELKIEPDSPRGRLYLMRGLAEGRITPDDPLLQHLDQCLGCRACETVCPAGVPYGRLLEETRGQLARRAVRRTPLRRVGEWALRSLIPNRARFHRAADLMRLSQSPAVAALMRSPLARLLPQVARRGWAMTPRLLPREERSLERTPLPVGARLERTPAGSRFVPAGAAKARVGFFTSCVMDVMFPRVNQDALRLLLLAGAEVHVPRAQGCCGALQAHAGLRREARTLARANVAAFEPNAFDFIVTDSAGCGAALRESGHLLHDDVAAGEARAFAARVRDIAEVLHELGLPTPAARLASRADPARPRRITYHDACHLAHAQKVRSAPRALLDALPGVERIELPHADWCCGSAGVYNITHPEMADRQLAHKLDAVEATGAETLVASNPGCQLHLVRGLAERGRAVEVKHLVELLAEAWPEGRA